MSFEKAFEAFADAPEELFHGLVGFDDSFFLGRVEEGALGEFFVEGFGRGGFEGREDTYGVGELPEKDLVLREKETIKLLLFKDIGLHRGHSLK